MAETKEKNKNIEMITGDPKRAIRKLSLPMMLSMFLITMYNLADSIQNGTILHCFTWKYRDITEDLPNIAKAGFFSSDRTIEEYNRDIWKLYPKKDIKVSIV